ncbi:hypothetical protein L195_g032981, partial [Trifolium pratense]
VLGGDVVSPFLVVSIGLIVSPELPRTPPTSGIRAVVRLGGRAGVDPGIGLTIGYGNSHLGRECCVSSVNG